MIKILFQDKRIFLVKDATSFLQEQGLKAAFILFEPNADEITTLVDSLLISEFENAIVEGDSNELLEIFKSSFVPIIAGGGLVYTIDNEVLFIYRRGKWDLPKGKLDEGETIEECAVREVMEETGLADVDIIRPLLITYHIYSEKGQIIFKTTHWFEMFSQHKILSPQREEGITKAIWIHKNNVHQQLRKTFESVIDIFKLVQEAH